MFQYVIKRILIFIPTLLIISLVAFGLSKLAPGDPVELLLKGGMASSQSGQMADMLAGERVYQEKAKMLGLDLPNFYFSLTTSAYPDTLHNVVKQTDRTNLEKLIAQYGNWPEISKYYTSLRALEKEVFKVPKDSANYSARRKARGNIKELYIVYKDGVMSRMLQETTDAVKSQGSLSHITPLAQEVQQNYAAVKSKATGWKNYIPALRFYGFNNQYHRWITNFFQGDFGYSYSDSRPVSSKIWDAMKWTVIINFFSILIAYIISIPIGVTTAVRKDSLYDRISTTTLFILYSLPSFWIGTLLIIFFTTSEYGEWLNWFPTGGIRSEGMEDASAFARFLDTAHHLVLPIFCVTYGSLAYISRQMRGGLLTVIRQDYIRTAKAKGLDSKKIIWKHAFRNSLFPIITLFAYIFPAAIAGSVAIEVIYTIPGMGLLTLSSIYARDWPVVFTILMFAAILTMIGNLIADMMYAVVDPRVTFE